MTNTPRIGKRGLKINNEKSSVEAPQKSIQNKENAEKTINEVSVQQNSFNDRAVSLANLFKKIIDDQTLPENKTIIAIDAEKDLINNLSRLGLDIDSDEYTPYGMGSIGLVTLAFRMLLIQRDKINKLSYKIQTVEKELEKIKDLDNKK